MAGLRPVARVRRRGTGLIAGAGAQLKATVQVGNAVEVGRPVPQLLDHEVDHDAFALHGAPCPHHPRTHDDPAIGLEYRRPDDKVGDAELILQRDEHHARGSAGTLPYEHEPSHAEAVAVAGLT